MYSHLIIKRTRTELANPPYEKFGQLCKDVGQACHSILYALAARKCLEDQVRT